LKKQNWLYLVLFVLLLGGSRTSFALDDWTQPEKEYAAVALYYNGLLRNPSLTEDDALEIARHVIYYSKVFGFDPRLIMAIIARESRFNPKAVSPKGAQGLGQLMPGTARELGVTDPFDINQNIWGTTLYLRRNYDKWKKSNLAKTIAVWDLVLASYNAGPGAVKTFKGVPPYKETQKYLKKIYGEYDAMTNNQ